MAAHDRFAEISEKVRGGEALSNADGVFLYEEAPFHELGRLAHEVRTRKNGKRAYYVVKRYLNTTNICYAGCSFCSFAAFEKEERAYRMSLQDIVDKASAEPNDYDELHIVGGHDPKQTSLEFWIPESQHCTPESRTCSWRSSPPLKSTTCASARAAPMPRGCASCVTPAS